MSCKERRCPRLEWQLLILAILLGRMIPAAAQTGTPTGKTGATVYRLIYAPLERIPDLTKAKGAYPPMKREDFFALVRALKQPLPGSVAAGVSVSRAVYSARLDGDAFVDGRSMLEIESLSDSYATLPLGQMNLAIEASGWTLPEATPAILGSAPNGQSIVLVPQSGTLQLNWSRRAAPRRPDELSFDFRLPPCPSSRLELTVPTEYALTSNQGVVRTVSAAGVAAVGSANATNVWQIDLGGKHECQILLRRAGGPRPSAWLHQVGNYVISAQGLELAAELHLDCQQEPLSQLALQVDPPLRLTKARYGEQPLSWISSRNDNQSASSVVLTFPQPIQGRNRVVHVSALAPLPETPTWRLPRIQTQQIQWQQEAAWLKLSPPLILSQLQLQQARQFQPSFAGSPQDTVIGLQYLSSAARVQLEIDRQTAEYEVTSGTTVRMGAGDANAEIRAEVRTHSNDLFQLTAEVASGWTVDSVEAEDRRLIHDWQIHSSPTAPRKLEVRFARPLDPRTPARLRIQARCRLNAVSEAVPVAQLRPLTFVGGRLGPRHFLVVLPADNLMLVYANDERVKWLRLDDLDTTEAHLIDVQPRDRIIPLDDHIQDATVALQPVPQDELPLTADVQITARLTPTNNLREQFRLALDRSAATAGPLRVRVSPRRETEIRWYSEQDPQRSLPARRLAADTDDGAGELWEIDWPEPTETPWVILGERTSTYDESVQISLLRLQNAKTQEGTVWVEAPGELRVVFQHSPLLIPVPTGQSNFRRFGPSRRAFRFGPSSDLFAADQGLLVTVSPRAPAAERPPVCIWRATVQSQLDPSGTFRSQASLQLENQGATELRLRMPAASRLRRVLINGSETKYSSLQTGQLAVALPDQDRFPLLQLVYESPDRPLGWFRSVRLTAPQYDAPVLDTQWRIWAPPDYALLEPSDTQACNGYDCLRRVFGRLLRLPSERPFDLFAREDWSQLLKGAAPSPALPPSLRLIIEDLGEAQAGSWRELTSVTDDGIVELAAHARLWIDEARLAAHGVTPSSRPPASSRPTKFERGVHRLQQAQLLLLQAKDGIVLTSAELLGLWSSTAQPLVGDCVARVPDRELLAANGSQGAALWLELVPCQAWLDQTPPWQEAPPDMTPYAASGWQLHIPSRPQSPELQLYRRDLGLVVLCAAFLIGMAVAGCLGRRHPKLTWVMLVTVAVLAILLPAPLGDLGPGACWGMVCGLLLRLVPRRRSANPADEPTVLSPPDSKRLPAGALLMAWVLLSIAATRLQSADQPVDSPGEVSPLHEVFIPTGEDEQPVGDYLYLPRSFQLQLLEESQRRQGRLAGWILQSAAYRAAFTRRPGSRTVLETLTAEYEIYVPELNLPLRLPLVAEAARVLEREARLDGRPLVLQWLAESSALILPIQQAGHHRLQLTFRPAARTDESGTVVDLPIPPAPRARLVLITPDRPAPVEIDTANGAVQTSDSTGQIQAELGPTDRLVVRWGVPTRTTTPAVEQSSWLRLSPEQVRLDVRLLIDTQRWQAQSILVEADERLQLDATGSAQPLSLGPAREDGVRLLQFAVLPDEADQAQLELNFVVSGWSGLGRLRLPRCRVLDQPDVSHWLGVSVDPRLLVRNESTREAEPRPVAEFAQRWGDVELPDLAFQLQDPVAPWTCSATLRDSTVQAEIQTAYEVFRSRTRLICAANLTAQGGSRFHQRLEVPEGYRLETVTLVRQGESQPVRWTTNSDGKITVMFDEPASGSYQLVLVGQRSAQQLGPRRLSRIQLLDCNETMQQLFVFRGSDVVLSPPSTTQPVASETQLSTAISSELGRSRQHAVLNLREDQQDPTVEVEANQPQMQAELINIVTRQQGVWYHQLEVRLRLEQGILDALRFEIPETWISGLRGDNQARILYDGQSPRPGSARVTIWPAEPWQSNSPVWFSVDRIPIPVSPGEPLTVPNIRLLEPAKIERYLYLPVEVDAQPVRWSTTGLEADEVGPDPAPEVAQAANHRCFRIRDESFQATRRSGRTVAGQPRVHLADLHLVCDSLDHYHGLALLDLEPGGVAQCQLLFPDKMRPLRVDVEDTPVVLTSTADRSALRLELMSDELPQRIGVLFEGHRPTGSSAADWLPSAPRLQTVPTDSGATSQDLPVVQTLWTVYSPANLQPLRETDHTAGISDAQQELLRLRHLSTVFDLAQQITTDFSRAELARWYSHWGQRFQTSVRRVERLTRRQLQDSSRPPQQLAQQQKAHREAATKLEVVDDYDQLLSRADSADQLSVWQQTQASNLSIRHWKFSGAAPSMPVPLQAGRTAAFPQPWIVAAILAVIGWGSAGLVSHRSMEDVRWLHALGVLAGVAWWLWLQPSVLGWLLVGLSLLLLALHRPPARSVTGS